YDVSVTGYVVSVTGYVVSVTGYDVSVTGYVISVTGYDVSLTGFVISVTGYDVSVTGYKTDLRLISDTQLTFWPIFTFGVFSSIHFSAGGHSGFQWSSGQVKNSDAPQILQLCSTFSNDV
ncbi:uncharacterized, partial [Tachysurus ichikawai]